MSLCHLSACDPPSLCHAMQQLSAQALPEAYHKNVQHCDFGHPPGWPDTDPSGLQHLCPHPVISGSNSAFCSDSALALTSGASNLGISGSSILGMSGSSISGISGSSILGASNEKDGRLKAGASSASSSCLAAVGAAFSTDCAGFCSSAAGGST